MSKTNSTSTISRLLAILILAAVLVLSGCGQQVAEVIKKVTHGSSRRSTGGIVTPTLILPNRVVEADAHLPVPKMNQGLYVFTQAALTRPQISALAEAGLRYLGPQGQHSYAFIRNGGDDVGLQHALDTSPIITHTAPMSANDNRAAQNGKLVEVGDTTGILVQFRPEVTCAEQARLLGQPVDIHTGDHECTTRNAADPVGLDASPKLINSLSRSPLVSSIEFPRAQTSENAVTREVAHALEVVDTRATGPQSRNLAGKGVVVAQWDRREVLNHPELAGRVINVEHRNNGRVPGRHPTHTAGTILGNGSRHPRARGFAQGATLLSYIWDHPTADRAAARHDYYYEVDNQSWGYVPPRRKKDQNLWFGSYGLSRVWDAQARDLLTLSVKASGNSGAMGAVRVGNKRYRSIGPLATAKNSIVVANSIGAHALSFSSSRGPTLDGRIKPDITARGVRVFSTTVMHRKQRDANGVYQITYPLDKRGHRQPDWEHKNGTSMSAPAVTGALAMLSELYKRRQNNRRWAPDMARAVLLHSAGEAGEHPGPDFKFGWGQLDVEAAAVLIQSDADTHGRKLVRGHVRENQQRRFTISLPKRAAELKVTICWLDPAKLGNQTGDLVHDLDLLLTSPDGKQYFPWTLNAAHPDQAARQDRPNRVDNIEQVQIEQPLAGTWTATITGRSVGSVDHPVQGFSLVTSHPVRRQVERVVAISQADRDFSKVQRKVFSGVAIPDRGSARKKLSLKFKATGTRNIHFVRLYLDIRHERRSDLTVTLRAPNGRRVTLETAGKRRSGTDLFTVYPDFRSHKSDLSKFQGMPSHGQWVLEINDPRRGRKGSVLMAALEFETSASGPRRAVVAAPTVSPRSGVYQGPTRVTMACATPGAVIRYTTDNRVPNPRAKRYTGPFNVTRTTKVMAQAFKNGMRASVVTVRLFTFRPAKDTPVVATVATPTISPGSGKYKLSVRVALHTATKGAEIRYTLDRSKPTQEAKLYKKPFVLKKSLRVTARAFKKGMRPSSVPHANFTFIPHKSSVIGRVATPSITPKSTRHTNSVRVDLKSRTKGADIRFTLNGKTPTSTSKKFKRRFHVSSSTTIKARAYKRGMAASAVAVRRYVVEPKPEREGNVVTKL
ncbi:chitobiase/beta-hexosaminidase C-terminal domain-containing protein, partial [bacterium AH-315-F18]|nr:chitobiase/beta-hexosaminidase C-terminal domain-containing protein [bacterium AH-315-F18]